MGRTRWRLYLWSSLTIVVVVAGALLVENSIAVPATNWMHQYDPGDFKTTRDLVTFLKKLRVPIPPVIAGLEIVSVQHTGSTDLVTTYLYRASLVGTYVLAIWFTYPSIARLCAAFPASLIFLGATVLIHPSNPQSYDILLPFFVLLCLVLLKIVRALPTSRPALCGFLSFWSGFNLSMAELARPFILLLLPLILVGVYVLLRPHPRRVLVAFLLPVVFLSGLWHVHIFTEFRQILASNYSGFNLRRAWPMAPLPEGMWETRSAPADEKSWPNLNTEEQHAASQSLQRVVLKYVLANPLAALRHGFERIELFIVPQTSMYGGAEPTDLVLTAYRIVAPTSFLVMFANVLILVWHALTARTRFFWVLAFPENLLLLIAVCSLLILSLSEANEEARLVLSILPFLAAYPTARGVAYPKR